MPRPPVPARIDLDARACALFAVWGTVSALAWSAIENRFWRAVAVLPLVLVFVAALAALMIAISTLERMIARKG